MAPYPQSVKQPLLTVLALSLLFLAGYLRQAINQLLPFSAHPAATYDGSFLALCPGRPDCD
jgi:hypothetical protein